MKRKKVNTQRLVLRPLLIADYSAWYKAFVYDLPAQDRFDSEPKSPSQCSLTFYKKLVFRYKKLATEDSYYNFGIFEKKSGLLVGEVDFDILSRGSRQFASFGYMIYNRYRGNGFGKEATKAALKYGFKELKLNRLEAAIDLANQKSIRLAKTIGMRREGIKKRYWFENDRWVDHVIYVANPEDLGLKAARPV